MDYSKNTWECAMCEGAASLSGLSAVDDFREDDAPGCDG